MKVQIFSRFTPPPRRGGLTPLLVVANLFLALNLFVSCQRDSSEQQAVTSPRTEVPAVERTGCSAGYCMFTVYATADVTVEFCGDITPSIDDCDWGCDTNADDRYNVSTFSTSVMYCVLATGSVCIRNPSANTINVSVQFGTSTVPVPVSLGPGAVRCFHSDDCESTSADCYGTLICEPPNPCDLSKGA